MVPFLMISLMFNGWVMKELENEDELLNKASRVSKGIQGTKDDGLTRRLPVAGAKEGI